MRNPLVPSRRFNPNVLEMMDRPETNPEILRDDLKNLRTINRYFGGLRTLRNAIVPFLKQFAPDRKIRILDLATGSADHPLALVDIARRLGRRITITAVDKNPVMLATAREFTRDTDEIRIQEVDLLRLPYEPKSFDLVLCSLVLHHFSNDQALGILRNIRRLARVGWIVQELNRSWPAAWSAWLYTHLTTRNPMTLYDSYTSVLRAFTAEELAQLARQAGIDHFTVSKHPFFRLVIKGEIKAGRKQ